MKNLVILFALLFAGTFMFGVTIAEESFETKEVISKIVDKELEKTNEIISTTYCVRIRGNNY